MPPRHFIGMGRDFDGIAFFICLPFCYRRIEARSRPVIRSDTAIFTAAADGR